MTEFEDHSPATVRFAPSLSEPLHIGDVRTVLFNWLFAMQHQGEFILRFDDMDAARPPDLERIDDIVYSPTFVLMADGREIGRILGYPGEDHFWGLLRVMLKKLEAAPGS